MCGRREPVKVLSLSRRYESRDGEIMTNIGYLKAEIGRPIIDYTWPVYTQRVLSERRSS